MMKIVISPEYEHLRSFVESIPSTFENSGDIIHQGRNILKEFSVDELSVIVKSFKPPHLINRIAYATVRKSKAFRSYSYALELLKREIQTPKPIAYLEEYNHGLLRSFYISEKVWNVHEMREFWVDPEIGDRYPILVAFGKFTADMHKKSVLHKDYSAGNILYRIENGKIFFTLVDINRIRFDRFVTEEEGYKNMERLWLPDECFRVIARSYAECMGYETDHAVERILYYKDCVMNK